MNMFNIDAENGQNRKKCLVSLSYITSNDLYISELYKYNLRYRNNISRGINRFSVIYLSNMYRHIGFLSNAQGYMLRLSSVQSHKKFTWDVNKDCIYRY